MKHKSFFVTATGTEVGKTVASYVLALLIRESGVDVGVMKPVQCGGDDAGFLKEGLGLDEDVRTINPYFLKEPLCPSLAFERQKVKYNKQKVLNSFQKLSEKHELIIVEGAGGLMVPLTNSYMVGDLISDLGSDVIIVASLGLGTVNHTLLTIEQLRRQGVTIAGVVFNDNDNKVPGVPEKTNPQIIEKLGKVKVLGTIPFLKNFTSKYVINSCLGRIDIKSLLRSNQKNISTKLLQEQDKQYLWHPFTQMQDWQEDSPLVIDEAEGSYLIDTDGNKYLDGVSSLWVNTHGHRHKVIDKAIKEQLDKVAHSTLLGLANTPSIELAKQLVEITPEGLDKVFYSDSGSTSVEIAIKMAYQYWQNIGKTKKRKLVHLKDSYHGDTLGSVSVGGIELFHKVYRDLIIDTISIDSPANSNTAKEFIASLKTLFEKSHSDIAALIVEPIVQGAAGMLIWPKGILKKMSQLCKKYDVIFITDEVATGFGRIGTMFACEQEKVSPDIMCLAKGLTGGYLPLAATLTSNRIYNGFLADYKSQKTFFHGHTYTGNSLCCAAALASLEVFKKEKTLRKLQSKIEYLTKRLQEISKNVHVGEVRQYGFMAGIELVKNKKLGVQYSWDEKEGIRVCQKAREKGVIIRPLGNTIVIMPPLSISIKELRELIDVIAWAIGS